MQSFILGVTELKVRMASYDSRMHCESERTEIRDLPFSTVGRGLVRMGGGSLNFM